MDVFRALHHRQASKKRDGAGSPAQAASGWPGSSAKSEEWARTRSSCVHGQQCSEREMSLCRVSVVKERLRGATGRGWLLTLNP